MPRERTVLILGAGASRGYGFPVGTGLRQAILSLLDDGDASDRMMTGRTNIRTFVESFQVAQTYSIDSFLARRVEFSEVGKTAIAYVLLQREKSADVLSERGDDHWYQYLVNELTEEPWDRFDPSWLSIVTFNYDRSLEVFLTKTICATYNKSEADVRARLAALEIVHVYGWLGNIWERSQPVPFGGIEGEDVAFSIREAASQIIVIPEGRADAQTLVRSRALISAATRICFLGFGFDATNVERLGAPHTFLNISGIPKAAAATALGLTRRETERASNRVFARIAPNVFHSVNCIGLLRETLILD